jgi:hypothetical protein
MDLNSIKKSIKDLELDRLNPINVFDDIKPYLSKDVLDMCENVIEELGDLESTDLHACFIAKTCYNTEGDINGMDLKPFAQFINDCKEKGLIEGGVLCLPFKIKLLENKWLLCFYPFTKVPNSELVENHNKN